MSTQQFFIQYIQTTLFMILGLRAFRAWQKSREESAAHLATATLLFGINSLIGAINSTLFDASLGETPPRWDSILSSTLLYLSIFFFLRFLGGFVRFPKWVTIAYGVATLVNVVLAAIERPTFRFDPAKGLVDIPGVTNPIDYRTYVGYVLLYLAVAFGGLFVAFLLFGLKVNGLARFRMLSISAGFFLLFVVIGLIPRLIFGDPSVQTIQDLLAVVRYVALGSAPLLLLGFAPPRWVKSRFGAASAE